MKVIDMKLLSKLLLLVLVVSLVFTRFWNIDYTARFTRDESSDLARMHSYWQDKKISLVGPISSDNIKVFGSLTYYMQMPFAVLWNFEPVGPAIGTAFWGILTVLLLFILQKQLVKESDRDFQYYLFLLVAVFWTPLLFTSRWAWNPHLVPFWITLALVIHQTKWRYKYVFTGLFMGMTIHHHYIAIVAVGSFGLLESIRLFRKRQFAQIVQLVIGYAVAVLPFIIFDLRHPPGLFLSSYLRGSANNIEGATMATFLPKLLRNSSVAIQEVVSGIGLQVMWLIGAVALVWNDLKRNRTYLIYFLPVVAQIIAPVVIDDYSQRYFLPASIFLLAWLIQPRKNTSKKIATFVLLLMLVSSLWRLPNILTKPVASPPLTVVTQSQHVIMDIFARNPTIKNQNIATLTGSDTDALAEKYRDLLSIRGINFRAASEYDASENLIVITTEDEDNVRHDQNTSMGYFKNTTLREHIFLDEKPWQIYWFSY